MGQAKREVPSHILISVVAALAISLLILLGAAAYWRLESLARESHGQTQVTPGSLRQRTEEVDAEAAAALQELQTLKREQVAVQSRIGALIASSSSQDGLPTGAGQPGSAESSMESMSAITSGPPSLWVPLYKQTHSLSCEATSASMVAAFFGVSLPEEEAITHLPRHENPNLGFRGDIDGPPGGLDDYGVYAGPIQTLLAEYGLRATDTEGALEGIRRALGAGHPVIAWITCHLWEQKPVQLELASGARIRVVPYEHAVVIRESSPMVCGHRTRSTGPGDFFPGLDSSARGGTST